MPLASDNARSRTRPHLRPEPHRGLRDKGAGTFSPPRDRHRRPMACEYPPRGNSDAVNLEGDFVRLETTETDWGDGFARKGRRWHPAYLAHTEAMRGSRSWSSRPSR